MSSTRSRNVALGLDVHLPVPAELVEAVDVERAQVHLQRLVHVVERHAQRLDLGAVDVHVELRRVGAELGGDAGQPGLLRELARSARRSGAAGRAGRARRGPRP